MLHQDRRQASDHRKNRVFRNSRGFAVLLGLLGLTMMLGETLLPALSFVQSYPTQFLAFYKPKVLAFATFTQQTVEGLQVSEQVSEAWDFTVALVTLTCVYHIIESARRATAGRLSSPTDATPSQPVIDVQN